MAIEFELPKNTEDIKTDVENTKFVEMDNRYEERRCLIKVLDEELYEPVLFDIERSRQRGVVIESESSEKSIDSVSGEELFWLSVRRKGIGNEKGDSIALFLLKNKPMLNIGSGGRSPSLRHAYQIAQFLDVSKCEVVDPYFDQERTNTRIQELSRNSRIDKLLKFTQDEGLRNLKSRPSGSINVYFSAMNVSNIDHTVGRKNTIFWLKRAAQEAYRVIPENGVLICVDSDDIANEAEVIFGKENKIDIGIGFYIFVKGDWRKYVNEKISQFESAINEISILVNSKELDFEKLHLYELGIILNNLREDGKLDNIPFISVYRINEELHDSEDRISNGLRKLDKETGELVLRICEIWDRYVSLP